MDPLSEVLRSMRLTGGVFMKGEFTAPWCISAHVGPEDCAPFGTVPRDIIAYHYVTKGRMLLMVLGQPHVEVGQGEVILLPRNDPHTLASAAGLLAEAPEELIIPTPDGGLSKIVHGGGGEETGIYCGFLGNDTPNDILLSVLPAMLRLKVPEDATGEWIGSTFRFAERTLAGGGERSAVVLGRLAELLFEEAVQRHVATLPADERGWLAGLRDNYVGRALAMLHGRPDRHWTTEALAAAVGLSRSAFAARFTGLIGDPPMRYLAKWRMQTAARRLADTSDPVARVAFEAGYDSEAAFNRAFKRAFGVPPAAWRRSKAMPDGGRAA
jgi:AraC-like DNA-binding protein